MGRGQGADAEERHRDRDARAVDERSQFLGVAKQDA